MGREKRTCPDCGEECNVIPLDNSFDYAGTHCTGGLPGTHKPDGFGSPVSDCCEAYLEDCEDEPHPDDWEDMYDLEHEMEKHEWKHP